MRDRRRRGRAVAAAPAWALALLLPLLPAASFGDVQRRPNAATSQPGESDDPLNQAIDLGDIQPLGNANVPYQANAPSNDFLPLPDRWRIGIPGNYIQNTRGSPLDPYNQNVLKGDYPILLKRDHGWLESDGFLDLTATSDTLLEARRLPVPAGVSTREPGQADFFGNGKQYFVDQRFIFSFDFFEGDAGYRPRDLEIRVTPVVDVNYLNVEELGLVDPDVRADHDRESEYIGFQELFVEKKLFDLSNNFDFVSVRTGIQGFQGDFRGFLFDDNEPGIRIFGNYDNNKLQYNIAWFHTLEKDTNSGLNSYTLRDQDILAANIFRQDLFFPGYTGELSFFANLDDSSGMSGDGPRLKLDDNGFLVRPEPIGTIHSKSVQAYYLGWAGDGHIGRFNITHQFYQALGNESFNPIAGHGTSINAQFAAAEVSYDVDYMRYRLSSVYASGDGKPTGREATGFDSIFDNPNFAGGDFSFFTRQAIALNGTGVNLVNRNSFLPDLRTSKEQGQANFVNPGLILVNAGADANVTQKVKLIGNVSYLQFVDTAPIKLLLQDNKIDTGIGMDYSLGMQYRPFLNNNAIVTFGTALLQPLKGFKQINGSATLYSIFSSVTLTF